MFKQISEFYTQHHSFSNPPNPSINLFDEIYSKNSNIVKYYFILFYLFY